MRHGLLAVHVLAGGNGVDDDLLMPMIGNGNDNRVDLFVIEQLFVAPRGLDGLADDLFREFVAAVVKIAGGNALDAGKRDSGRQ